MWPSLSLTRSMRPKPHRISTSKLSWSSSTWSPFPTCCPLFSWGHEFRIFIYHLIDITLDNNTLSWHPCSAVNTDCHSEKKSPHSATSLVSRITFIILNTWFNSNRTLNRTLDILCDHPVIPYSRVISRNGCILFERFQQWDWCQTWKKNTISHDISY